MIDYADIIRQSVTMPQLLHAYGYPNGRFRRIPCPLHDGEDNNFSYKERSYRCYVCGKSGGVIDFVMDLFGLPFQDAMRRINEDCALGLDMDGPISDERQRELSRLAYQRRKERKRIQNERKRLYTVYHAAFDRYRMLEDMAEKNVPQRAADGFSDEYVYAVTRLDAAWQDVEDAADKIYAFEKERG